MKDDLFLQLAGVACTWAIHVEANPSADLWYVKDYINNIFPPRYTKRDKSEAFNMIRRELIAKRK